MNGRISWQTSGKTNIIKSSLGGDCIVFSAICTQIPATAESLKAGIMIMKGSHKD
jgi:hypothetical protein